MAFSTFNVEREPHDLNLDEPLQQQQQHSKGAFTRRN